MLRFAFLPFNWQNNPRYRSVVDYVEHNAPDSQLSNFFFGQSWSDHFFSAPVRILYARSSAMGA
eukprot:5641987-Pleurochrysis_carterae.AAC.1